MFPGQKCVPTERRKEEMLERRKEEMLERRKEETLERRTNEINNENDEQ